MRDETIETIAKTVGTVLLGDELAEHSETTRPQPNSLDPGDPICAPVQVERERRKHVDAETDQRLIRIESLLARNMRATRITMVAMLTMVAFASLEYAGIIGHDRAPIWATAVVYAVQGAQ